MFVFVLITKPLKILSRVSRWSVFGTYMVQKIIIDENCTKDHVKTLQMPCKDHYEVIVIQPIMFNFAAG